MSDDDAGWTSKYLWRELDNLPDEYSIQAMHSRYGDRVGLWGSVLRERERHRDLEVVVRDQRTYIAALEGMLKPHLLREAESDQGLLT